NSVMVLNLVIVLSCMFYYVFSMCTLSVIIVSSTLVPGNRLSFFVPSFRNAIFLLLIILSVLAMFIIKGIAYRKTFDMSSSDNWSNLFCSDLKLGFMIKRSNDGASITLVSVVRPTSSGGMSTVKLR